MLWILFFAFMGCLVVGVPIAFSMGVSVVATFMYGMPRGMMNIPTKIFAGLDSFTLMAIPFFILAGDLMTAAGISRKLINFADLLVGWIRGGLAFVTVVACVIFASVCGSAAASTSAIGGIMISAMAKKGYDKGFVACLVASGGTIGPIIPPSILAVLYGSATGLSVGALFIAGVVPGLVLAGALMFVSVLYARKHPEISMAVDRHMTFAEGFRICVEALPALLMPVIIIGGILTGIVTATEASGIACLYGIAVGFCGRTLTVRKCWEVLGKSACGVSKLMIIVGIATLFGWILSVRRFPNTASEFMTGVTDNPYIIMFMIIGLLIAIGFFMETVAALIILIPVLYPLGQQIGFDPIHYAMIIIVTLLFGAITPPVGILLYITSNIAEIKFHDALRYIWPFVGAFLAVILLLLFFPSLTIWLPQVLGLM